MAEIGPDERNWTLTGDQREHAAIYAGPAIRRGDYIVVIPVSQAIDALEETLAALHRPDAPRPDTYPAIAHAIQTAETTLTRLRGRQ